VKKVKTGIKFEVVFVVKKDGEVINHCCFLRHTTSQNSKEIEESLEIFYSDLEKFKNSIGPKWEEDSYLLNIIYP
jgi:hypothetical protein